MPFLQLLTPCQYLICTYLYPYSNVIIYIILWKKKRRRRRRKSTREVESIGLAGNHARYFTINNTKRITISSPQHRVCLYYTCRGVKHTQTHITYIYIYSHTYTSIYMHDQKRKFSHELRVTLKSSETITFQSTHEREFWMILLH